MRVVLATIGDDICSPRLYRYRCGPPNCLACCGHDAPALQLCFDSQERFIQTVDRRPDRPRYSSLEYKPSLSTIRFPHNEIITLLHLPAAASS